MARKTIAQILEEQRVLIFNSSKPEVEPFLANMGADETFIKTGEDLYNSVITLSENQEKEQQEQNLAYDQYHELKDECKTKARKNFR